MTAFERRAAALVGAAAVALVAIHVHTRAATLTELDSTNLALALQHYDVSQHRPHPPGHPLVVASAHVFGDPSEPVDAYLAFVLVAALVALAATAALAREMFGASAAAIAALLSIGSPLFLYYGSIVSVYPAEAALTPLVALIAYRVASRRDRWSAFGLAPSLALAAGFRPAILLLLAPMCAAAVAAGRPPARRVAAGGIFAGLIEAAWLLPMLAKSGGVAGYAKASSDLYALAGARTSFLTGGTTAFNAAQTLSATVLAAAPALAVGAVALARQSRAVGRTASLILVTWIAAYLGFYSLIHFGKPGYVLAYVPAICVGAAGLASRVRIGLPAAAAMAAAGLLFFALAPTFDLPAVLERGRVGSFLATAASIDLQDRQARALERLAGGCPPASCTIVSTGTPRRLWEHEPWSLARWYARNARIVHLRELEPNDLLGRTALWVGADPPAAVARLADRLHDQGLWQVYRSSPALNRRLCSELRLAVAPRPLDQRVARSEASGRSSLRPADLRPGSLSPRATGSQPRGMRRPGPFGRSFD